MGSADGQSRWAERIGRADSAPGRCAFCQSDRVLGGPAWNLAPAERCDAANLIHEVSKVHQLLRRFERSQQHLSEAPHTVVLIDGMCRRLPYGIINVFTNLETTLPHGQTQHCSMPSSCRTQVLLCIIVHHAQQNSEYHGFNPISLHVFEAM